MNGYKITLQSHRDALLGNIIETKTVITGVLHAGQPNCPMTYDVMKKAESILSALESGASNGHVVLMPEQWAFLKDRVQKFVFTVGGKAMMSAIEDIMNAEVVTMDAGSQT